LVLKILDSEEQKQEFRKNPDLYLQYRKDIEYELNSFKFIIKGSKDQSNAVKVGVVALISYLLTLSDNYRRHAKTVSCQTSSGQVLDPQIRVWMPWAHARQRVPGSFG
jgi:hypothetical protein